MNNWLWTKGRNTFNIGGEFRRPIRMTTRSRPKADTSTSASEPLGADPNDPNFGNYGSPFASFLSRSSRLGEPQQLPGIAAAQLGFSPYFQDDIKLIPA